MEIGDAKRALSCLHTIGYYRLSGYWFPFRHQEIRKNLDGIEERHVSEHFRGGTRFEDVMNLYVFDKSSAFCAWMQSNGLK